jgi:hypothetical protein
MMFGRQRCGVQWARLWPWWCIVVGLGICVCRRQTAKEVGRAWKVRMRRQRISEEKSTYTAMGKE